MRFLIDVFVEVEADNSDEAVENFLHGDWLRSDIVGVDKIMPRFIVVGQPKLQEAKL